MAKKTIESYVKEKFDYDVTALPDYVDEQNNEINMALVEDSQFISKCNVLTGVKGEQAIEILSSSVTTQAASSCGWNASGGVIFTDVNVLNRRLKVQEAYCNETLNGKWTQMKNAIGANVQDLSNPFGDVIIAYKTKQLKKVMQDQVLLGDTGSGDANLAHFDGLVKLWNADASLIEVPTPTTITSSNAFGALKDIAIAIPTELRSAGVQVEILCGEETAQACIDQIWNDKDYNGVLNFNTNEAGELWFTLPTTTYTVRVLPQLNGTANIFAVPYNYIAIAVDGTSDEDGMSLEYAPEAQELRLDVKYRLGVNYIFPEYFVKGDKAVV